MLKVLSVFLLALTLTTTQTLTAETAHFIQKRSIMLSGVIDETALTKANELAALAEENKDPIDVLIASPGGVISYGLYFIQAIKLAEEKGVKVRCYVPALAASMAYTIFTQCTERYALPYAELLFHSPRISGSFTITTQDAVRLASGLKQLEVTLLRMIMPVMQVTKESGLQWFAEAYTEERMFIATDLLNESPTKWFKVVGKIEGCPNLFPDPYSRVNQLQSRKQKRADYEYIRD